MVKEKVSPFLCRRIGNNEDTKETKIFRESNNEFLICKVIVYVDQL